MKSIVFFNNKGGVGKTTLTCNVAAYLNQYKKKRVLLVDADPQCNATQAILDDDKCASLYLGETGDKTIFDYLSPIEAGEPTIVTPVTPLLGTQNGFGVDLIPGHPRMSMAEDQLSGAWGDLMKGTPSGYRVSNWCSQLFQEIGPRYDLVVFDVGPSLGALNRTVILSCDYLITPFGGDIFSLLGIQNISSWIKTWKRQYERGLEVAREERPEILQNYPLVLDTDNKFRFAGYSVQQYVTRTFKTGRRPVKAYDRIMSQIPETVQTYLDWLRPKNLPAGDVELGHIPFLYSLVPLAQAERVPIHGLKNTGRLVGSQFQQVDDFQKLMESLSERLLRNVGLA